ncbi:MAG: TolC family protein [Acidobacteriota bacterium]
MKAILRIIPLGLLLLPTLSFGQQTLQLSLAKAVDIALAENGSARVALAEQSIHRAETQVSLAKSAFMPVIDGSAGERNQTVNLRTFGLNFSIPGVTFPSLVGPFSIADIRANAKFAVIDFTNLRRYRASKSGLEATKADLEVTRTDVSQQVAQAYLATLRADAALEASRANVELSQALVTMAQSQKDAGSGTLIEVTRAQVQLANDKGHLTINENERRRAELQLLRVMGLDMSMPVKLTDTLGYHAVNVSGVEASLSQARGARNDLKAQKAHEDVAHMNVSTIEAERLPTVGAFGDYGAIGQPTLGLEQTRTVGITVSVPIFDGGRRKARVQESLVQYKTEQIRTRDLEQGIEMDVRMAIDSLHSADVQVETAREGLTLAENEVAQAQRRYQAGVSVPLEVTDAQTRLDRARDNQIVALYNHNLARLSLAMATGTIQEFVHQ